MQQRLNKENDELAASILKYVYAITTLQISKIPLPARMSKSDYDTIVAASGVKLAPIINNPEKGGLQFIERFLATSMEFLTLESAAVCHDVVMIMLTEVRS